MAVHVGQMTAREAMRYCFEAVTTNAARVMGLDDYGLEVGRNGDLVVLQAADAIEAIRLKARRLFVVRRGKVIAESARAVTKLDLPGRPGEVDAASYVPARPSS